MTKVITVEGMMCKHCAKRVENAVNAIEGAACTVDLEAKTATVTSAAEIADDTLKAAITDAGYTVVSIA